MDEPKVDRPRAAVKNALRTQMRVRRCKVTAGERKQAAAHIQGSVLQLLRQFEPQSLHIYCAQPRLGEIDTEALCISIAELWPQSRIVRPTARPDADMDEMTFDVIIIPILAFDRGGFRLGMGGGWYDRFLALQPQALKIGLAYDWAEVSDLPHETHDIPVDIVVTSTKVHICSVR